MNSPCCASGKMTQSLLHLRQGDTAERAVSIRIDDPIRISCSSRATCRPRKRTSLRSPSNPTDSRSKRTSSTCLRRHGAIVIADAAASSTSMIDALAPDTPADLMTGGEVPLKDAERRHT
jgi:hypothetical protein